MTLEELEEAAAGKEAITILQAAKTLGCDPQWLRDWIRDEKNAVPFPVMKNEHKILVLKRPFMAYVRGLAPQVLLAAAQALLTAAGHPAEAFCGKAYRIGEEKEAIS